VGSVRHYILGGQETLFSPVLKVPRQCPLVLLLEVCLMRAKLQEAYTYED
jgi:hypothetical protein